MKFLVNALKAELARQLHNATGAASESIHVEESGVLEWSIIGNSYLYWVNFGRQPGKWPNIAAIRQWVEIKNIGNGKDVNTIAFLIARAIKEKGTPAKPYVVWATGNSLDRTDFVTRVLKEHEQELKEFLGDNYQEELFGEFIKKTAQEFELVVS